MKNLTKALLSGALVVGMAEVSSAQGYFVTLSYFITGSVSGTHPLESSIVTTNIDSDTFPGFPFNVHYDFDAIGANGLSGIAYNPANGQVAWTFANFGPNYTPTNGFTTWQLVQNLTQADWATPNQILDTGVVILNGTNNGQPLTYWNQIMSFDDTAGGPPSLTNETDPTPPTNPGAGTGAPMPGFTNGLQFTGGGGTLGSMAGTGVGGGEGMSLLQLGLTWNGLPVAAVYDIIGCTNPPYTVVLNVPTANLAGISPIMVAHNNLPIPHTTNVDGATTQIEFTLNSCSPVFVQDGDDPPLSVELSAFNAVSSANGRAVTLTWTTESETNNAGFILENKVADGTYREVASYKNNSKLVGQGNKTTPTDYSFVDSNVEPSKTYTYRLSDVDYSGLKTVKKEVTVTTKVDANPVELRYALAQNHPNPFNPSTVISFDLKEDGLVNLSVYNVKGQLIKTLVNENRAAGNGQEIVWDATDNAGNLVSSGVYFYKVETKNFSDVKKMTFLK